MMNVLILEDEVAAAIRLKELVAVAEPGARIVATTESIADSLDWLGKNPMPDLILSDIQLADGLSFEVFQQMNITAPVIFTTAFDAYTLKAFKLNSIDYLLKPIDLDELKAAFAKYHSRKAPAISTSEQFAELFRSMTGNKDPYKSRFLVRHGERLSTISVSDMAFVRADDKVVFLYTLNGQKHIIEDALDDLTKTLDPVNYFRLNRTYIAPLASIEKIQNHFNGRLKITLKGSDDNEIFVSRARVNDFKKWLNK